MSNCINKAVLCHSGIVMRRRRLLAMLLAVGFLATGCLESTPPKVVVAPLALKGTTVEVSAPPSLRLSEQWSIQVDEWQAVTGATLRLNEKELDGSTPPASASLAVVPLSRLPGLVDANWMAPIENADAAADWEDTLRGLRNGIAKPGGHDLLIPVACPVLAVYYRADLLAATGRQPPDTWEQYQSLLASLGEWSGGLPAFEPWSPEFRSTMLQARAAGYALHPDNVSILLDLQDATPLINGPPFVQALTDSRAALTVLDPQSLHMSPEDCCRAVLEGRAALAIGLPPQGADAVAPRSDAAAVVGTAKLPGASRVYERSTGKWIPMSEGTAARVTIVGFRGFAVCASAAVDDAARAAAWQFWLSMRRTTAEDDVPFGTAICRSADMPAALRKPAPAFTSTEWRRHLETTVAVLQETRVLIEVPLPDASRFREKLTAHVSDAIGGRTPAADALQQAAADWNGLIDEIGRERVLSVYRRCHGLSPK